MQCLVMSYRNVRIKTYIYRLSFLWEKFLTKGLNSLDFQGTSRSSSILYFNCGFICEHLLFVQHKTTTKVRGFFQILQKSEAFYWILLFVILSIYKPTLGSCEVPHSTTFGLNPFSRSDVYCIQTDRQAKYIQMIHTYCLRRKCKCFFIVNSNNALIVYGSKH